MPVLRSLGTKFIMLESELVDNAERRGLLNTGLRVWEIRTRSNR